MKKIILDKNILNKRFFIDSRDVKENSVFICIKGKNNDGHKFANYILENFDRTIVVCEKNSKYSKNFNKNIKKKRVLMCSSTKAFLIKIAQIKRLILNDNFL